MSSDGARSTAVEAREDSCSPEPPGLSRDPLEFLSVSVLLFCLNIHLFSHAEDSSSKEQDLKPHKFKHLFPLDSSSLYPSRRV